MCSNLLFPASIGPRNQNKHGHDRRRRRRTTAGATTVTTQTNNDPAVVRYNAGGADASSRMGEPNGTGIPELPPDTDALTAALAYAGAGISVLPVQRGTKDPGSVVGRGWPQKSSRDPAQIAAWFAGTDYGIAIDTGASGLVVIDVDNPALLPGWLQDALTTSGAPYQSTRPDTPGRGHYVFGQPPAKIVGCGKDALTGMGLDVKGDGGVVIAEPTVHPGGGQYRWVLTGRIPVLPDVIAGKLSDRRGERVGAASSVEVARFTATYTASDPRRGPGKKHAWSSHFNNALAQHDSRHDTMARIAPRAMEECILGYFGAADIIGHLRTMFVQAKTRPYNGKPPMSTRSADAAFDGIIAWAIGQATRHDIAQLRAREMQKDMIDTPAPPTWEQAVFWGDSDHEDETADTEADPVWHTLDGASFILDQPADIPAIWGGGDQVLWADGEALMIAGGQGLGKTTLAGQLLRGLLGLEATVLGHPIGDCGGAVLYLAMDRPRQIARSLARQFTEAERAVLARRLIIRPGPPVADLAKDPTLLLRMARELGATVVVVDSLKDAAVGLSDDEVGAGYNRARQHVLNSGRQHLDLHHVTKASAGSINDIYGSTWLTSGCGSVILLTGEPGDPLVGFRQLKPPVEEVGPYVLEHDAKAGRLTVHRSADLLDLVEAAGPVEGLTATGAAKALFDTDKPTRGEVEKVRRRLERLTADGVLDCVTGTKGGARGGVAAAWFIHH